MPTSWSGPPAAAFIFWKVCGLEGKGGLCCLDSVAWGDG